MLIEYIYRRHPKNRNNPKLPIPVTYTENEKNWADKICLIAPKEYRIENEKRLCICGGKLIKRSKSIDTQCNYCGQDKKNDYDYDFSKRIEMWTCPRNSPLHRNGYNLCIHLCNKKLLCTCGEPLLCIKKSSVKGTCGWCDEFVYKPFTISNKSPMCFWHCIFQHV